MFSFFICLSDSTLFLVNTDKLCHSGQSTNQRSWVQHYLYLNSAVNWLLIYISWL